MWVPLQSLEVIQYLIVIMCRDKQRPGAVCRTGHKGCADKSAACSRACFSKRSCTLCSTLETQTSFFDCAVWGPTCVSQIRISDFYVGSPMPIWFCSFDFVEWLRCWQSCSHGMRKNPEEGRCIMQLQCLISVLISIGCVFSKLLSIVVLTVL